MEQTITQMIKNPKIYDDVASEKLWNYHHGLGSASSHDKLLAFAQNEGMYNSKLGRPSRMGPWRAMWAWAFRNPKEAYPAWEKWMNDNISFIADKNVMINFDTFLKEILKVVYGNSVYQERTVRKWCEKWKIDYDKWKAIHDRETKVVI